MWKWKNSVKKLPRIITNLPAILSLRDALRCTRCQCPREDEALATRVEHQLQGFLRRGERKPPSATVHVGVKREKIPAVVNVRPRGHRPGGSPCLVGRCINSSWRRALLPGKEGRDRPRIPSARMFACYYCRQIPTSRAADAHYNCKRGGGKRALSLPRVAG